MTELLVSVRNAWEAGAALEAGAAIIDVKEPESGSLGPAESTCWWDVARVVDSQVPVSVALGELLEGDVRSRIRSLPAVDYAKIGLAGCGSQGDWPCLWHDALLGLPRPTASVAVAYVDWENAGAPRPESVLEHGIELGVSMLLLDTFGKQGGWLLDCLTGSALSNLVREARTHRVGVVLAGSVDRRRLPQALAFAPDFVAVRGAVCAGGRTSPLTPGRVRQLVSELDRLQRATAATDSQCDSAQALLSGPEPRGTS